MLKTLLILLVFACSACSVLKASPAARSSFLPVVDSLKLADKSPFNALLADPKLGLIKKNYNRIQISQVNFDNLKQKLQGDLDPEDLQERLEETAEVANYLRSKFIMELEDYPNNQFMITEQAGPNTFIVSLAIIELEATNPIVNSLGTAAGFFIPGGGLIKRFGTGSIAIEGFIKDGDNNQVLLEFADREADKSAPFTVKDFQEYAHVRAAIDDWAEQYAELINNDDMHIVDDSLPFELLPF
jgi:hypothetical protein